MKIIKIFTTILLMIWISLNSLSQTTNLGSEQALPPDQQRKFDYFFIEALHMKATGDYDRSIKLYTQCLEIDPSSAVCKYEIATLLEAKNDKKNIVHSLYLSATELNSNNHWYLERLGQFYLQNNLKDQAIEVYKKLSEDNPSDMSYAITLTQLLKQSNRITEAIEVLDNIQKVIGPDPSLIMEKQQMQIKTKDYDGALKDINLLIEKYPNDYRYALIKGDIYMDNNQYKKAYKCYSDIEDKLPENGNVHLALAGYYEAINKPDETQAEVIKAFSTQDLDVNRKLSIMAEYLQVEQNNLQDSNVTKNGVYPYDTELMLETLLAAHPNEPAVHRFIGIRELNKSDMEKAKGDTVAANGHRSEAMKHLEDVVNYDSSDKDVWGQLLYMKVQDEDWIALRDLSARAIASSPLVPSFYFYNGLAYTQIEDYNSAANAFEIGVSYCFKDDDQIKIQLLSSLGDTYYKLNEKDKAFSTYDDVLEMDEHNLLVLNNYAYYLSISEIDLNKAEKMSKITIDLEPLNGTYLDTYAWILYKQKKYSLALKYIIKATEMEDGIDDGFDVWDHYGDILLKNDQPEAAKEKWIKAIDLGGDAVELNRKINSTK